MKNKGAVGKHTPGPWTPLIDEIDKRYFITADKFPPFGADICYGITNEANASLIASAPELLEALKLALYATNGFKWKEQAREAIAKAEGRV